MTRKNALVLISILLISVIGFYIHTKHNEYRALAFCAMAAALITFFAILSERAHSGVASTSTDSVLRKAIAASLVVEYMALVGMFAFWGGGTTDSVPLLTQQLITSFTTIVGVVLGFYYGSSAYVEAKKSTETKSETPSQLSKPSPAEPPLQRTRRRRLAAEQGVRSHAGDADQQAYFHRLIPNTFSQFSVR